MFRSDNGTINYTFPRDLWSHVYRSHRPERTRDIFHTYLVDRCLLTVWVNTQPLKLLMPSIFPRDKAPLSCPWITLHLLQWFYTNQLFVLLWYLSAHLCASRSVFIKEPEYHKIQVMLQSIFSVTAMEKRLPLLVSKCLLPPIGRPVCHAARDIILCFKFFSGGGGCTFLLSFDSAALDGGEGERERERRGRTPTQTDVFQLYGMWSHAKSLR